jgi:hypothetical protein
MDAAEFQQQFNAPKSRPDCAKCHGWSDHGYSQDICGRGGKNCICAKSGGEQGIYKVERVHSSGGDKEKRWIVGLAPKWAH